MKSRAAPAVLQRGPAADAIEYARRKQSITQRSLALRAGLHQSYVNKLEHGMQPSLLAFARLASVLKITPLEVWTVVMAEAHLASQDCPRCGGKGEVLLPHNDDLVEFGCPLCRPWPEGFPGERHGENWIIAPYGPNEPPQWYGWEQTERTA